MLFTPKYIMTQTGLSYQGAYARLRLYKKKKRTIFWLLSMKFSPNLKVL